MPVSASTKRQREGLRIRVQRGWGRGGAGLNPAWVLAAVVTRRLVWCEPGDGAESRPGLAEWTIHCRDLLIAAVRRYVGPLAPIDSRTLPAMKMPFLHGAGPWLETLPD